MSRESFVFLLGCLVFITPFLGVPSDWKKLVYIAAGALLMFIGYSLRRSAFLRSIETAEGERRGDSFVESIERGEESMINDHV